MDDRKGLVQVHNEPGAIRFKYDVVGSTLSLALPKKPVSREALQLQPELAAPPSRPVELPSERENGDAAQLDDFLAFDPPKEPVEVRWEARCSACMWAAGAAGGRQQRAASPARGPAAQG